MWQDLLTLFRKPSARVLAQQSLEEHERLLLSAYAQLENAEAAVRCYSDRLQRLREYLKETEQ